MRLIYIVTAISIFLSVSCRNNEVRRKEEQPDPEKMMNLNKEMIAAEQEDIDEYILRYNYTMQSTQTGLHYMVIEQGSGKQPVMNNHVTIEYRINLLDGTYCYSSDSSGALTFILGQSTEPGGLQEGLTHLKEGGKALLIVPSWLAYGLTGDGDRIGSGQTLVYQVKLNKVD